MKLGNNIDPKGIFNKIFPSGINIVSIVVSANRLLKLNVYTSKEAFQAIRGMDVGDILSVDVDIDYNIFIHNFSNPKEL
jgi:hypothetical protein